MSIEALQDLPNSKFFVGNDSVTLTEYRRHCKHFSDMHACILVGVCRNVVLAEIIGFFADNVMGNAPSDEGTCGWRVLKVMPNSPCTSANLVSLLI